MTRALVLALLSATTVACAPTARSVIEDAADAMGGEEAVLATNTLVLEGTGQTYRLGQNKSPDADLPVFEVHSYRREVDLENRRWRVDQVRTGHFLTGNPVDKQPLIQAVDGTVAYDVQPDGTARRQAAQVGKDRQAEYYHHPLTLIRAALAEGGATLGELQEMEGMRMVEVTPTDGPTLTVHFDAQSRLPTRIESTTYDPNYGDVVIATTFGDWKPAGDLVLPGMLSQTLDKWKNGDFTVASAPNGEIQALAAPADVASAPDPVAPPLEVSAESLAPGVWYIGPGYNSTLIEFPTYAVLVEASQNDERALATIAKSRELLGDKPIKYLVNTHFHIDHSGGVRAAVAEGLTVLTHEIHKPYFEDIVGRSHTIVQDHLAKNPKALAVETIAGDGPMEITEGDRTVMIHRLVGDEHADGMLMLYLPKERILIEADAFTPNARAAPFAANLLAQVKALGWNPARIAPVHGNVVAFAELEKTVRAAQAATR